MAPRETPIVLEPIKQSISPDQSGALIFLHGLSDEAAGVSDIGVQLQSSKKLPHIKYVFPNALENRDMMTPAWYIQSRLTPNLASRPELEEDEDESGLLQSIAYIESLIQDLTVTDSIPLDRIVVGGFSQGMAVSLLLSLTSARFAGRLGGVLAMCGYLPLEKKISNLQSDHGIMTGTLPGSTRMFVMRGKADALVPKRYFHIVRDKLNANGYIESSDEDREPNLVINEYEGVGHTITGSMIADMATWLEETVPELPALVQLQ